MIIYALVEGPTDEVMACRLAEIAGHQIGACYGKRGVSWLKQHVVNFNGMASAIPMLALVDFMDTGLLCPPDVVRRWLPQRHSHMIFRLVVRELESWLLADRKGMAAFLGVPLVKMPQHPEILHDPKQALVNLARRSRYSSVRTTLVPRSGTTARVGRLYTSEISRFIREIWDAEKARANSLSLHRCLLRLEELEN